jgi:hypothetical protein
MGLIKFFSNKKLRETKDKVIDLNNQILHIKNDLEDSQKNTQNYTENEKKFKQEIEHWKGQYNDMQRCERTIRIDLDEVKRAVRIKFD